MTGGEAKRLVVVGTVGSGLLAGIASVRRGYVPSARIGVGVVAAGVLLAALAEVAPDLAGGFAVLMLVTATFVLGGGAWAGITAVTQPQGAK